MTKCYLIIDGGSDMAYHLLFYMLAQFINVDNSLNIHYYIPTGYPIVEGCMDIMPKHWTRHRILLSGYEYTTEHIRLPAYEDSVPPQAYFYIRYLFGDYMSNTIVKGNRYYISRNKGTVKRQIENEKEVLTIVESFGFKKIYMEELSVREQIELFSSAECIITPHGSALAFSVFGTEGLKIVEIFHKPLTEKKHYLHIAEHLNFDFLRFQDCIPVGENLHIDCEALSRKIEAMFGEKR